MTERTDKIRETQKKYYNEKCKTSEEFIKKRNDYNANYFKTKYEDPLWREKRLMYYKKYRIEWNKRKAEEKLKNKKEQLLLQILIRDTERND